MSNHHGSGRLEREKVGGTEGERKGEEGREEEHEWVGNLVDEQEKKLKTSANRVRSPCKLTASEDAVKTLTPLQ